jgi:hypothetical protein
MAVCLHCLHEARVAARDRRYRIIMRTGAWIVGVAVVGIVGAAGANAVLHPAPPPVSRHARRAQPMPAKLRQDSTVTVVAQAAPVIQQGVPAIDSTAHASVAPAPSTSSGAIVDSVPAKAPAAPTLVSILPQGRSEMPDSVFAVRTGDTIAVHFDTSPLRTRRADKFDGIVRQTLHAVYGAAADSALSAVPAGRLAAPNELVTKLPSRGVHLATPSGARLVLWPETRPGRDGPLVVGYRVTIER